MKEQHNQVQTILKQLDTIVDDEYLNDILSSTIDNLMQRFDTNADDLEDTCCDFIQKNKNL